MCTIKLTSDIIRQFFVYAIFVMLLTNKLIIIMKKILIAICLMCGTVAPMTVMATPSPVASAAQSSDYRYVGEISAVSYNGKIRVTKKLYTDGENYYVGNNYARVMSSDKSGYGYMFYQGNTPYYFNM